MKTEDLKGKGLTDEQVSYVMAEYGKELTAKQNEYATLESERNKLNEQLTAVQESLKKFDGVDVEQMKNEITTLNQTIKDKDDEYAKKDADRAFNDMLKDAINEIGGRSVKSVMAELDIDTLKSSKNQKEDIKSALESCKKEHDFLFGSNEPINNVNVASTPGGGSNAGLDALRSAMGLEPQK